MIMDGGINIPRVPPAAMLPVANRDEYRRSSISGRATRVMVATVATEEPQTAPKPADPPMVARARPPR